MAKALMGSALLAGIAAGTVTRITTDQAASLDATHFEVNTSDTTKEGALVRLTEAGQAAVAAAAGGADTNTAPVSGGIAIDTDVAMPDSVRVSRSDTLYPFDKLEVGHSFHVPRTDDNQKPEIRLSSSVSGAHVKFSPVVLGEDGKPVMETYDSPVYAKDEAGNFVKDATTGKRVVERMEPKTREKRGEPTKQFKVVPVGENDPRGVGARVFRVK